MKVHKLRARLASAKATLRLHLLSGTRAGRTRVLFLVLITLLLMAVSPPFAGSEDYSRLGSHGPTHAKA
jgi:hypothetical protein